MIYNLEQGDQVLCDSGPIMSASVVSGHGEDWSLLILEGLES